MKSWASPSVPALPPPATPLRLRLHDTARGAVVDFNPGNPARLYVCGITPYDATHLGHAATYLTFDTLQRVWRDTGLEVTYVQNVTDVDDPLLERARENGEDWSALAHREIELFRADMAALRILPPTSYPGVVESIDVIADFIGALVARGAAYTLDGDIYFSVAAAPDFGEVAHLDVTQMLSLAAARGGDPDRAGKKDPLDALLWQAARPGEPSWPSPFGPGRPGWHIECAALSLRELGPTIDVQGGGSDLAFPHHELSAAQGECASGQSPYARCFVHAGMVGLDGEKMSKSRGNLVFVSALRAAGVDPAVIRLALLDRHYRADLMWSPTLLDRAAQRLSRWRAAAARGTGAAAAPLLAQLRGSLSDDLDTPAAIRAVDGWVQAEGDEPSGPVIDAVDALLGISLA